MWHSTKLPRAGLLAGVLIIASICLLAVTGCVTTDYSDMPWNVPQSWEGSPSIPGLTPGAY